MNREREQKGRVGKSDRDRYICMYMYIYIYRGMGAYIIEFGGSHSTGFDTFDKLSIALIFGYRDLER